MRPSLLTLLVCGLAAAGLLFGACGEPASPEPGADAASAPADASLADASAPDASAAVDAALGSDAAAPTPDAGPESSDAALAEDGGASTDAAEMEPDVGSREDAALSEDAGVEAADADLADAASAAPDAESFDASAEGDDAGAADAGAPPDDGLTDDEFRALFVARALALWPGVDYSAGGRQTITVDGAGSVLLTLWDLGYQVPDTTADGLYNNYFTASGTDWAFPYSSACPATAAEIANKEYDKLLPGNLLLVDYDFDYVWDHVVIYLGAYQGLTHAALTASDYYDEAVIADLDSYADPLASDLEWSNLDCRQLDHAGIETVYSPSP